MRNLNELEKLKSQKVIGKSFLKLIIIRIEFDSSEDFYYCLAGN